MDDHSIIALYEARDERAIDETARAYGARLRRLADSIVGWRDSAEECVNDTYLSVWNAIPPQRPAHFFGWMAKICRNLAFGVLDRLGAQKRSARVVELTAEMEECIPDRLAGQAAESAELSRALSAFLRTLPEESLAVFMRRYFFGRSIREIAAEVGMSEGAVRTRLSRLRAQLRNYLDKEEIEL